MVEKFSTCDTVKVAVIDLLRGLHQVSDGNFRIYLLAFLRCLKFRRHVLINNISIVYMQTSIDANLLSFDFTLHFELLTMGRGTFLPSNISSADSMSRARNVLGNGMILG